jgi:hypothetical protein
LLFVTENQNAQLANKAAGHFDLRQNSAAIVGKLDFLYPIIKL